MAIPSTTQYFEAAWTSSTPPTDPSLFTAAEIVAGTLASGAVSTATSAAVSTVNAAAPDSVSISQANSRATSAASVGSVADSKAVSGSVNTSVADSKGVSGSTNTSIADSKAVSVANSTPVVTAVQFSGNISVADSKATSTATVTQSYPLTASETGVTNLNYPYGDIRRHGGTSGGSTGANDTALANALLSNKTVALPLGTFAISATVSFQFADQEIVGQGNGSVLLYSGGGTALSFNAKSYCSARDFQITLSPGTVGIDLPFLSHDWEITRVHISGATTAAVKCVSAYYGELRHCDIETNAIGFWGASDANGNSIVFNSFRQNLQGVRIEDTVSATDSIEIAHNQIESARVGTLYGVALIGCTGAIVESNRIELTVGTAHLHVNSSASHTAQYNELNHNKCRGSIDTIILGDAVGASQVIGTQIFGGSGGLVTINTDCDDTIAHLHGGPYPTTPVNNGVRSSVFRSGNLSFSCGITGCTTAPTATFKYALAGDTATVWIQQLTATSNTTACTLTGLPTLVIPKANNQTLLAPIFDNGVVAVGAIRINTDGTITLSKGIGGAGGDFTAANAKGISPCVITYKIN